MKVNGHSLWEDWKLFESLESYSMIVGSICKNESREPSKELVITQEMG